MFKFFEKNGQDVSPTAECLMIPEVKKIWDRDNMKSKSRAKNDLAIVYFAGYYNSPYIGYGEDEMWNRIARTFKNNKNWRPWNDDKELQNALDAYVELQRRSSSSLSFLETLRSSFNTSERFIKNIQKEVEKINESNDKNEVVEKKKGGEEKTKLDKGLSYVQQILKISTELPKTNDLVKEMEEKVFKELSESGRVKGGGQALESERRPSDDMERK